MNNEMMPRDNSESPLNGPEQFIRAGYLDTSATNGNVATQVILPFADGSGHLQVPLLGSIDVVDMADLKAIERPGLNVHVEETETPGWPKVFVTHHGTDGQSRTVELDVENSKFIPSSDEPAQ